MITYDHNVFNRSSILYRGKIALINNKIMKHISINNNFNILNIT